MDSPPPIAHALMHHVSGHFVHIKPVRTARAEPMDYLLIWPTRGRLYGTAGDHAFEAGPGDLILFEPAVAHDYRSEASEDWEWLWVHFGGALAPVFADAIRAIDGSNVVHLGLDDGVRARFAELLAVAPPFTRRMWRSNLHADTCLVSLLGLIVTRLDLIRRVTRDHARLDAAAVQAHLHQHLHDRLDVEALAARFNLSPSHFSRTFRSLFGTSPMRHVIELRVGRAATLLSTTDLKLVDIASAVGYDDPYYFSRLFRNVTGVAPRDYRQAARQGRGALKASP